MISARRTTWAPALVCALVGVLAGAPAARAQWVERPFAPPLGTRWIVQSDETSKADRGGQLQIVHARTTAELTFSERTADGYRIVYTVRNVDIDGPNAAALAVGAKALERVTIRATVDANGMPLRIDNLDEVHAALRAAIDRLVAPLAGTPQGPAIRRMATAMLVVDGVRAAKIYLAELPLLALGQNPGLRPGETRDSVEEIPNPSGGAAIKSRVTLRIDSADAVTGNLRLVRTRGFDPDTIKDLTRTMAHQLTGANSEAFDKLVSALGFTFNSTAELSVEGGMTRAVREHEVLIITAPGQHALTKTTDKTVTVAPAT